MIRVILGGDKGLTRDCRSNPKVKILSKGGEENKMPDSEEFGELVKAIMGNDGAHTGQRKTGISSTYLAQMRNGRIPGVDILGKLVAGYEVSEKWTVKLFDLARIADPQTEPERLINIACTVTGISQEDRLEMVMLFRSARSRARSKTIEHAQA